MCGQAIILFNQNKPFLIKPLDFSLSYNVTNIKRRHGGYKTISLKKDNLIKKGLVGFSWTTFFFGFFVPIIRGDARWAIVMVVAALFTFGLSNIVFAFIYNKQYTTRLLESGYEPADEYSRGILQSRDMIA